MARRSGARQIGAVEQRPAIEGDRLYVPLTDGRLLALDLESGTVRGTRSSAAPPTEPLALADRVYLGAGGKHSICLQPRDGDDRLAWQDRCTRSSARRQRTTTSRLFRRRWTICLRALGRGNGSLRWKTDLGLSAAADPRDRRDGRGARPSAERRAFDADDGPSGRPAYAARSADLSSRCSSRVPKDASSSRQ